ncbi:macro domain-containing protein [Paraburkholderia sp. C35]|uniref:macro domain-containing protein n=1 Tax=Paraburkholderia sp. C35 TaxID=2126993 RepID=UPI000D68A463|nr:macro domain-containing protein [Paraburkholderia sp. C35]
MKIKFCDTNANVANALHTIFAGVPDVTVMNGNILTLTGDAIVSPANSFGRMDGGIDAAYVRQFGIEIQRRVQAAIGTFYDDGLPVGEAITVKTGHAKVPLLIAAPTMRVPGIVSGTDHAYQAMRAALRQARQHNVKTLLCPGLCTLTGRMDPYEAASQMHRAYVEFKANGHINIEAKDLADWLTSFLQNHANLTQLPALITAERALSVVPRENLENVTAMMLEQIHRRLTTFEREPAARALALIADALGMGSLTRTPDNVAQGVMMARDHAERMLTYLRMSMDHFGIEAGDECELPEAIRKLKSLAGKGALTAEHDTLENAARSITRHYSEQWAAESDPEGKGVRVGTRHEDDSLNEFIHVYVSNYSMDEADDYALAQYITLVRPANIAAMFDLIREQANTIKLRDKELEIYRAAASSAAEMLVPGGALLESAAI